MKTEEPNTVTVQKNRVFLFSMICGVLATFLGVFVLLGWYTHNETLIRVYHHFSPMQFNTALGFALSGLALVALTVNRSLIAIAFSIIVCLLGFFTLVEYIFQLELGIDHFFMGSGIDHSFMESDTAPKEIHPGRMSPNTSLCFFLYGLSFLFVKKKHIPLAISISVVIFVMGALALIVYLLQLESAYGWSTLTRMAIHTAFGFLTLSTGMICFTFFKKEKKSTNLWGLTSLALPATVIVLTASSWYGLKEVAQVRNNIYFETLVSETEGALKERYRLYEQSLFGGVGLFYASKHITRNEWRIYAETVQSETKLPGISGIGYIDYLQESHMEAYLQRERQDGAPNFMNHPITQHSDKFIIRYIEPQEPNAKAVGLDIGFETHRREAAEYARDYGVPTLTKKIDLVQDKKRLPGFLLLVPLYSTPLPPPTIEGRKSHLLGWVYAPFIGANFIQGLAESKQNQLNFQVYDGRHVSPQNLISSTYKDSLGNTSKPAYKMQTEVNFANRPWTIEWHSTDLIKLPSNKLMDTIIPIFGFIFAGLLYFALSRLLHNKDIIALQVDIQTAALEKSETQMRLIIDNMLDGMATIDEKGTIKSFNKACENIFGFSMKEAMGKNIKILIPEPYRSQCDEYLKNYKGTEKKNILGNRQELLGQRKDGTIFPIELSANEIKIDDKKFFIGLIRDISDIKLAEEKLDSAFRELELANKELEKFAYIASHDLKAPMRGIDNLAQWISEDLEEVMNDDTREKITMLRQRIARLETLLEDILSYSRAGRIVDEPEDVNIDALVREIVDSLSLPDGFNVTIPKDLPEISSFRTPLQQVFLNLISNAHKHHDKDEGRIEIFCKDRDEYYEFAVQDNGPGIPEEFQERVFEMFQTLQSRDKVEGTGLGMAIIKKLTEWQGGKVWIESKKGKRGTTVRFLWPKTYKEMRKN